MSSYLPSQPLAELELNTNSDHSNDEPVYEPRVSYTKSLDLAPIGDLIAAIKRRQGQISQSVDSDIIDPEMSKALFERSVSIKKEDANIDDPRDPEQTLAQESLKFGPMNQMRNELQHQLPQISTVFEQTLETEQHNEFFFNRSPYNQERLDDSKMIVTKPSIQKAYPTEFEDLTSQIEDKERLQALEKDLLLI